MTTVSSASGRTARAVGILFFAEMAFSPIIAAIALLAPVAFDWGAFRYVPAIVWLAIFAQCLVVFRWRGLWFLLGPLVSFLAIEAFLVAAPPVARTAQAAVAARDIPNAPKADAKEPLAPAPETEPPLIVRNPDGTFTIQKQPPKGTSDNAQEKGLRIPPQVIVPTVPAPDRK